MKGLEQKKESGTNTMHLPVQRLLMGSLVLSAFVFIAQLQACAGSWAGTTQASAPVSHSQPNPVAGNLILLAQHLPAPGQWSLVPNTDFLSHPEILTLAEADAIDPGIWQASGVSCVIECFNGAAWDSTNHRMYLFGGGHNGYAGNEVYELDLEALTLRRLLDPSPLVGTTPGGDGIPIRGPGAPHTYDGMIWSPATNSFFMFASTPTGGGEFDLTSNRWLPFDITVGWYPMADYDTATNQIYVLGGNGSGVLQIIDPVTRQVVQNLGSLGWHTVANLRLWNGNLYKLETGPNDGVSHIRVLRLSGGDERHIDTPIGLGHQAGFAIRGNQFVFWDGGKEVWIYDNGSGNWTSYNPPSGPASHWGGRIFSRWVYLPDLDAFAGYTIPGGLWLFKP